MLGPALDKGQFLAALDIPDNGVPRRGAELLGPGHGGSIADPMGKNLPPGIHTLQDAIAAGITKTAEAAAPGGQGAGNNQQPALCVR